MAARRKDSPRERRREREQALRRSDIVAAASSVFAEKGFHGAQISEIAAAAEVSLKSVYSLFAGKEEIYQRVISTTAERMREAVHGKVEAIPDPVERLLALIDLLFECFEENKDLLRIYVRSTQGLPWKVDRAMGRSSLTLFQAFRSWVIRLAEDAQKSGALTGVDPEAFALAIVGSVSTTATHWIETSPGRSLADAAPSVRAIFRAVLIPAAETP